VQETETCTDGKLRIAILLFALAAPILAATTFAYSNNGSILTNFARQFSTPVTIMEWLVVAVALAEGLSPTAQMSESPKWMKFAVVILLGIAIWTAAIAKSDPLAAIVRTGAWICHLAFGLSLYGMLKRSEDKLAIQMIWPAVMAGLVIFALGLALFVFFIPSPEKFVWVEFYYGIINVRQLGFYSAAGVLIAFGLAISQFAARFQFALIVFGSVFAAITFWSGTRSSLFAIGFGVASILIVLRVDVWFRELSKAGAMILGGAALSWLHHAPVAYMGIRRIFNDSVSDNLNTLTNGRIDIWIGTAKMVAKQPFFGYGESQFRGLVPENQNLFNHPHNGLLQICFQWGILGGLCFFALLGAAWWQMYKVAKTQPDIGIPAFLVINGLFAMSMIEGSLYHTWPVAMMAFCVAVALGGARALRGEGMAARL
jgi:O-antigen ligase